MPLPTISNLVLHYDATTLTLNNNDVVNVWNDISGNSHNMIPISNNPPVYKSSGSSASRKPSVKFNGAESLRTNTPVMSQPVTYIVAAKMNTVGFLHDGTLNANRHSLFVQGTDTFGMFASIVVNGINVPNSTGTNGIIHTQWNSSTSRLYFNNALIATINPGNRGTTGFVIGTNFGNTSFNDAEYYEVLAYNKILSNSERNSVYGYLNEKWYTAPDSTVKVWDGTSFEDNVVRYWNGTEWVVPNSIKTFNGTEFL